MDDGIPGHDAAQNAIREVPGGHRPLVELQARMRPATHTFDDAWDDVHVLFAPETAPPCSGFSTTARPPSFLADRGSRSGWVTSVCNGSLLLGTAGLLNGYEAASHWYTRHLLARYGAVPKAERVVIDRNRVTGGA